MVGWSVVLDDGNGSVFRNVVQLTKTGEKGH